MDSLNLKKGKLARGVNAQRFEELQLTFLKTMERMKHALTLDERIELTERLQQITREQKELLDALGYCSSGDDLKTSGKRK